MREPPEVTVVDPRRPAQPVDVLDDGGPGGANRLVLVAVVPFLLIATVAGVDAWRKGRASDAERRRLAQVVDMDTSARFAGTQSSRSSADVGRVERTVGLRNRGPLEVVVVEAVLGDLRLQREVVVRPGQDVPLTLARELDCSVRPGDALPEREVALQVRTASGDLRDVTLPLPGDDAYEDVEAGRRACGYLDVFEAASADVSNAYVTPQGGLALDLLLVNSGRVPVRLTSLQPGAGLAAEVRRVEGGSVELPLVVPPPAAGDLGEVPVVVTMRVTDCAAVRIGAADDFAPELASSLTTLFDSAEQPDAGAGGTTQVADPDTLLGFLREACPRVAP